MATTTGAAQQTLEFRPLGNVLITGGCGFLGGNIISLLSSRSASNNIHVIDLRPSASPQPDVKYHFGDITDYDAMCEVFDEARPQVVIHTASPHFNINNPEIMYKVNVEGTQNLIKVAQEKGVRAFVYTSSASVISDTQTDLVNADEEYPLVMGKEQPEYYTTTKVRLCHDFHS